jgi:5-methylcytosine-specific restriction endonuclease McrA
MKPPKWTEAEDAIIREHYPKGGARKVASLLEKRSAVAVRSRACILDVKKSPSRTLKTKVCTRCLIEKDASEFSIHTRQGATYRNSSCRSCAAEYARNRPAEKKKQIAARYNEKYKAQGRKRPSRQLTPEQRERARKRASDDYYKHREERLAKERAKRSADPERFRAAVRERHRRDPSSAKNAYHKRKARLTGNGATLTRSQWKSIIDWFANLCAYCGIECERLTQDHVIPISRGGTHDAQNVVPACRHCNARKYARTPEQAGMPIRWPEGPRVLETE